MDKPCPMGPVPVPDADRKPKNIREYLQYVNHTYPGGFRALRLNILNKGKEHEVDTDMVDAAENDEDAASGPNPVDVYKNVFGQVDTAHNSAALALDLISLILSKENPSVASMTLRGELQAMVGLGKLGTQKHAESALTPEKKQELSAVTNGWNVLAIDEITDSTISAAAALEKEVDREGKYWEDVLSIREGGWSMCRMPRERQTLGVRFGFNEANPEFRDLSLAPMRQGKDGSVELDLGVLGGQAQRLVVTLERDGKIVGMSSFDAANLNDPATSLAAHVLEARNTIFARELWHELQMESRSLLSYDVKQYETAIVYTGKHGFQIKLELLSPSTFLPSEEALPENLLAESIQITLSLLLEHYHRQQESLRSRPAPPSQPRSQAQVTCYLLRPIIARIIQMDAIEECTRYIGKLVQSLKHSKIAETKFELVTIPVAVAEVVKATQGSGPISPTQALFQGLLQPPWFAIDLTIMPGHRMSILGQTYLTPVTTTLYQVNLRASPQAEIPNTLIDACPPSRDYPSFKDLREYLNRAVSCAVTNYSHKMLEQLERKGQEKDLQVADDAGQGHLWQKSVIGTSLFTSVAPRRNIRFEVACPEGNPQLVVSTRVSLPDGSSTSMAEHIWQSARSGASARGIILPSVLSELVKRAYR